MDSTEWMCEYCGNFVREDEGITTNEGLWVCDKETCRTLDPETEESYIRLRAE